MTDILIRDVPDDVIKAIDAKAQQVGLSRSEYLRRALAREGVATSDVVVVSDLVRLADMLGDLDDPEVMKRAWR